MEITTVITVSEEDALEFIKNRGWVELADGEPNPETFIQAIQSYTKNLLIEEILIDRRDQMNGQLNLAREQGLQELREKASAMVSVEVAKGD